MDKKLSNKEMYDLLDLAAKKETDKKVSKINKELFTWFILLLIACLLPLFLMAFIPNMETASS